MESQEYKATSNGQRSTYSEQKLYIRLASRLW